MYRKNVDNSNTVTKKCGEIIITMKKNAKNVYSFNCWFCGTICIQMKKFTLHLEREHNAQLEQTTSEHNKEYEINQTEIQKESSIDNMLLVEEIKIEDCDNDDIKLEMEEDKPQKNISFQKYQDPLETVECNEIPQPDSEEKDYSTKQNKTISFKNEPSFDCEEMETHSDDYDVEHLENDSDFNEDGNTTDSDYIENNSEKNFKLLKDKKIILPLIEAYYKIPELWNPSVAIDTSIKQRKVLIQTLTDELNTKLKKNFKYYSIKNILHLICNQYEKEIRMEMNKKKTNKDIGTSQLWFYEHMSFLKSITESKIKKQKKGRKYQKVQPLEEEILCEIIDIYKNYTGLWDVNDLAYTVREKRSETLQLMVDEINTKMNISLNVDILERNLKYIHKFFVKDKQMKMECETKQIDFQPTSSFFNKCEFLVPHEAPFKCPYCSKILMDHKVFQIHKSEHDGTLPFICKECGAGFKLNGNYTVHVKRHLRVFKFRCKLCEKGYPIHYELEMHMRSHTGAQPYLCSVCGEAFRTAISYDNHIRRHEDRFRYSCHICKRGFNVLVTLNDHVKAHLNVRDFICTECGKSFTSRKYLNYHKRIHGAKNYTCKICGKSYAQDAGLRQHKKTHGTPIGICK